MFERFCRAESFRAGQGTRLGLAIARVTIEALEERIEVQSAPGEGTAFTVRLPPPRSFRREKDSQRKVNPL